MRVSLLFLLFISSFQLSAQEAKNGLLDLRGTDLSGKRVSLDGEWEFYWQRLIDPCGFDQSTVPADHLTFPGLWNKATTRKGIALSYTGYATYKLLILLPENRPSLGLSVSHFYNNYNLFVGGELAASDGQTGTKPEDSEPHWEPKTIVINPSSDTLEVVLQISNFQHSKGGARETIYLGDFDFMMNKSFMDISYDLLLSGCLIMAGLFFLGLFFFGQREIYIIAYALFCLFFSYRFFGADNYILHILYPRIPWIVTLRLEYATLFLAPVFFAIFSYTLFPRDANSKVLGGFVIVSAALAVVSLVFPPSVFTRFVEPYLFLMSVVILYIAYVYFSAARHYREGAMLALASTVVVFAVFLYKFYVYLTLEDENRLLTFAGFLFFFFFQSLNMFFRVTRALHRAREEAENASRAKSEFLSMMSHEIRTPMNAVIGLTNYLMGDKPKKEHKGVLETLKFSAENLLVIINDILDFHKIEAKKIEFEKLPVNIVQLMQNLKKVFDNTAQEKGLYLTLEIDKTIREQLLCDATRTSQIMSNLISNALKFTKEGGVEVSVKEIWRQNNKTTLRFSVKDTGIGISKEDQKKIFESFTQASTSITREFGGTGLGLTITRRLLGLQGVELQLQSQEKLGSEFYFMQEFAVVSTEAVAELEQDGEMNLLPEQCFNVLLVEDNKINVLVAQKFLTKWGFVVEVAFNGSEAIELVKSRDFDLILMDLQMPVLDGYEATRKIRQLGYAKTIIALTASTLTEDNLKLKRYGMDDHVLKPFNPDELYSKIVKYLTATHEKI